VSGYFVGESSHIVMFDIAIALLNDPRTNRLPCRLHKRGDREGGLNKNAREGERVCRKCRRKGVWRNCVQVSLLKSREYIKWSFLPPHKANLICRVKAWTKKSNFVGK